MSITEEQYKFCIDEGLVLTPVNPNTKNLELLKMMMVLGIGNLIGLKKKLWKLKV